jgi:hypothetical protein
VHDSPAPIKLHRTELNTHCHFRTLVLAWSIQRIVEATDYPSLRTARYLLGAEYSQCGGAQLLYINVSSAHLPPTTIYSTLSSFQRSLLTPPLYDFLLFNIFPSRCCSLLNSQHITVTRLSMTTLLLHHRPPLVFLQRWHRLGLRFLPQQAPSHSLPCLPQSQRHSR